MCIYLYISILRMRPATSLLARGPEGVNAFFPFRSGMAEVHAEAARHRLGRGRDSKHSRDSTKLEYPGAPNNPKLVLFTYFRPQSRYYLYTWSHGDMDIGRFVFLVS